MTSLRLLPQPSRSGSRFSPFLALIAGAIGLLMGLPAPAQDAPPTGRHSFELNEGDRVLWIGSEFTEQAIKYNFVEAALTARWPDRKVTFRNLGWAGDQPNGIARGYFGGAEEGYRRLIEEVSRLKPTVIFLEYGENAAYQGAAGHETFRAEMKKLIADLKKQTPRIYLVSPPAAEKLAPPLPDPTRINQERASMTQLLKGLAQEESLGFIDIFTPLSQELAIADRPRFTTDTIRYTRDGYAAAAEAILNELGITGFNRDGGDPELRELIRLKNDLYFHQYRPQNETYLRGFRKHEQGQNAKEIAEFEPLIAQAEARIHAYVRGEPLPPPVPEPEPKKLDFVPLPPAEQQQQFKIADGFEIAPFASEPMVANPIQMNFDAKGRLWIATSPIYPQIRPGAQPSDELIILEDTDGDHIADKRTVFATGLLIPTAVLPDEKGGCYVANSTELLHLADTDGDGVADQRTVVLAGFGTEDTHHILHTFRWTPDALLSFNQSIYIHSQVETPYGVQSMLGSGFWRYRPETARANTVAFGLVNPWGYIFDRWGQSFATDGAGGHGINYIFPGAAYMTAVGYNRVLEGMNPGQPKFCGLEILCGDHFTEDDQNVLVTADFRGNRVCRFRLSEENSGYISRQLDDLLTCSDPAFRPVDLKLAPDGSLYIADWHNPIINHGEVDFRDPRRDDRHGRIWRVTRTNRPATPKPDFAGSSIEQLLDLLKDSNVWTRQMARVHLRLRNHQQVAPALSKWMSQLKTDAPEFEQLRLEGLWTWQALGAVPPELLQAVLNSEDHHARAAAVRVLSQSTQEEFGLPADFPVLPLLKKLINDPHPQVRLEVVNAVRQIPSEESLPIALTALDHPMDKWIDFALWSTVRTLEPFWMPQLQAGTATFQNDPAKVLFVIKASDKPANLPTLMKLLTSGQIPANRLGEALDLVGKFAGPNEARTLFDWALQNETHREAALRTLLTLADRRNVIPAGDLSGIEAIVSDPHAIQLVAAWKVNHLKPRLVQLIQDPDATLHQRVSAVRGLATFNEKEVLRKVAEDKSARYPLTRRAATAFWKLDRAAGIPLVVELLQRGSSSDRPEIEAMLDEILSVQNGGAELGQGLQNAELSKETRDIVIQKARAAGGRGQPLLAALGADAAAPPARVMSEAEISSLLSKVKTHGNAANGERIFRRKDLACLSCHSIGGAGGQTGPDLLSLGASSPVDYILESLLNPSAKIKEGYHTNTIATDDGKIYSGILVREGDTEVVIRDANNREIVIPKAEIDERSISTLSLMPGDVTSKLNNSDMLDLVVFLSSLGKEGPYKVPQKRLVRKWITDQVETPYSRVDGMLPLTNFPGGEIGFELNVSSPGKIGLRLREPDGLTLKWNGQAIPIQNGVAEVELPQGRQLLTIGVPAGRSSPLMVELIDLPGSSGNADPANQ